MADKLTRQGVRDLDGLPGMRIVARKLPVETDCNRGHHTYITFACGICWMGDDHCSCYRECSKCGDRKPA